MSARGGARRLTRLVAAGLAPRGSLRIFGDWFGRPHDNVHRPVDSDLLDDRLTVRFDGGETLMVWQPHGVVVSPDSLIIDTATRVRWEWFLYGRAQTPENLRVLEYWFEHGRVRTTVTAFRDRAAVLDPAGLPAVELT